jgi:large subunit ribosomal protein L10
VREPRPEKVAVVREVGERLDRSRAAILTEYRGLKVNELQALRRALGAVGGEYGVYKNTLVRRAAEQRGLAALSALLEGPTAIAFVRDDAAAVAKVLRDFARTHPSLVVKGGLLGGNLLDARAAAALADLPSREVLLAQVAATLAAPLQSLLRALTALPQGLAYGLAALLEERRRAEDGRPGGERPVEEDAGAMGAPASEA